MRTLVLALLLTSLNPAVSTRQAFEDLLVRGRGFENPAILFRDSQPSVRDVGNVYPELGPAVYRFANQSFAIRPPRASYDFWFDNRGRCAPRAQRVWIVSPQTRFPSCNPFCSSRASSYVNAISRVQYTKDTYQKAWSSALQSGTHQLRASLVRGLP